MAKYDTYSISIRLPGKKASATLSLSVLFEEGDKEKIVMKNARKLIVDEAEAIYLSGDLDGKKDKD